MPSMIEPRTTSGASAILCILVAGVLSWSVTGCQSDSDDMPGPQWILDEGIHISSSDEGYGSGDTAQVMVEYMSLHSGVGRIGLYGLVSKDDTAFVISPIKDTIYYGRFREDYNAVSMPIDVRVGRQVMPWFLILKSRYSTVMSVYAYLILDSVDINGVRYAIDDPKTFEFDQLGIESAYFTGIGVNLKVEP